MIRFRDEDEQGGGKPVGLAARIQLLAGRLHPQPKARHHEPERVRSNDIFRSIIERERGRASRNRHCFSLAVFCVPAHDHADATVDQLLQALVQRSRFTDEVGWLGARDVGVLLPETSSDGAWAFADQVRCAVAHPGPAPTCRIYVYPEEAAKGGHDDDRQMWFAGMDPQSSVESIAFGRTVPSPASTPSAAEESSQDERNDASAARNVCLATDSIQRYLVRPPAWKRWFDIVGASLALVALGPLMLLASALIRLVSPGPALFRQERIGLMGKPFMCWKFRTMHIGNDGSHHQAHLKHLIHSNAPMVKLDARTDPRIIPFGKLLRQTGIDELPQLLNVLRGEMSLIGPRPCIRYEYNEFDPWHRQRTDALPGLTGLWQVSGKNRMSFAEMIRLDITYVKHLSFWLDLRILLRTLPAIVGQIGGTK